MDAPETSELNPGIFLAQGDGAAQSGEGPDLLILNQPISDFGAFSRLWTHARYRICADGGANRLHDMFSGSHQGQRKEYVSKHVCGGCKHG
jgi:thiamine pyrophosphokinase